MPRHVSVVTIALLAALAGCAPAQVTPRSSLAAPPGDLTGAILAAESAVPGAVVRVAAFRLNGTGPRLTIRADSLVHAASTMKVPVMIALAHRAGGLRSLDATIPLTNRFTSIVDGSPYTLSGSDDSDDSVYARVGSDVTIRWLATRMITHSSNLATNTLLTVVAADSVTSLMRSLGATRMLVRRGVEDTPAFRAGLNNVTTAADLAAILAAIATDRAASPLACAWMRDVLFAQHWNDAIPTGLPPGTRIAHKTGNITRVEHDAAIVYPPGGHPYVLVILTSGVEDSAVAKKLIADIARLVHTVLS